MKIIVYVLCAVLAGCAMPTKTESFCVGKCDSTNLRRVSLPGFVATTEAPPRPSELVEMATCKDGVCTLSESDWQLLQAFHRRVVTITDQIDAQSNNQLREIARLEGMLARRCFGRSA